MSEGFGCINVFSSLNPSFNIYRVTVSGGDKAVTAPIADPSHHIFFAFFGGDDDKAALRLVLQLAENPDITATIVHFEVPDAFYGDAAQQSSSSSSAVKAGETVITTSVSAREQDSAFFASLRSSLPAELSSRVVFETVSSEDPVKDVIARASIEVGQSPRNAGDLVVLGRNIGRNRLQVLGPDEIRSSGSTLGFVAERVWESKLGASVLVVKAGVR